MTLYGGAKSLDAEIVLNLIEGTVTMDYTLNKFGSPYASNNTTVLESEFRSTSILLKFIYLNWLGILLIASVPLSIIMVIMSTLGGKGLITNPKIQYYYQCYLKFFYSNLDGIGEQSHEGKLYERNLEFKIPTNIWIEYHLTGEYQTKIKSISLLRNFVNRKQFGKFHKIVQSGWNVIFEFTDPPQNGSAKINYI